MQTIRNCLKSSQNRDEAGIQQEALHGIVSTIRLCRKFGISREETLQSIMSEYELKREDAEKHMRKYWL